MENENSRTISRRRFLGLAGGVISSAFLASCSPTRATPASQSSGKVQLVYQDWRTEWFPPMVQQALEEFHATHPNIRVYYVPDPENVEDQMVSDMQAGTAPDVLDGCCAQFPVWAQTGQLLDLRPYVKADLDSSLIADWDPAQYKSFFTKDGKQYALPKYHGALALFYNKDLFDQYHVSYPDDTWNHDDYLSAMRKLTKDRNGDGHTDLWGSMVDISWDRIQVHVNSFGGNLVDPVDSTISRMGEPKALAAMEWLRARMWDDKVMATMPDVQRLVTRDAFAAGRVAMVEDGSWALRDILAKADFRVGVAPFPAGPARRVTIATTDGFAIYAGTKHPDEAWELMKFLISKEYGLAMAKANFLQPARASLVDDWVRIIREEFPEKAKDIDLAVFADGHIKGYSVTAEAFENMALAKQLTQSAWDRIFTLGQAPVDSMKTISDQIQQGQPRA